MFSLNFNNYQGLHSQMTACEWIPLQHILSGLNTKHAIEVGTYQGGSLQVLAHFCERVISIDIEPSIVDTLGARFSNVTFHTGNSAELLPSVLRPESQGCDSMGFVLIDGDHSSEGVRRDINALLSVPPL